MRSRRRQAKVANPIAQKPEGRTPEPSMATIQPVIVREKAVQLVTNVQLSMAAAFAHGGTHPAECGGQRNREARSSGACRRRRETPWPACATDREALCLRVQTAPRCSASLTVTLATGRRPPAPHQWRSQLQRWSSVPQGGNSMTAVARTRPARTARNGMLAAQEKCPARPSTKATSAADRSGE